MEAQRLPAAVLLAARDRRGGATEIAARALDGLLEIAADAARLEAAMAVLLAGQPAMAPIWHLAVAAAGPDPPAALAALRRRLDDDAEAAVAVAAAWLGRRPLAGPGAVATVSHSSLVDRVLVRRWPSAEPAAGPPPAREVAVVGADAIGPEAFLNAAGTAELAASLPTLVVATAIKLVPAGPFARLAGPGFEPVRLDAVDAVVLGPEVLSPAEAGRRAAALAIRGDPADAADPGQGGRRHRR
jgi:hypothetical protein